jgi:hypothetical protein
VSAFRNCRSCLRQAAGLTLVAWLFALTAGVVNACMLNGPSLATRTSVAQLEHSSNRFVDANHREHGLAAHPDHEQNDANDSCLRFCDDESSALPKGSTPALDPGVAIVAALQWRVAVVPIANVATGLSLQRPTAQGPPLVIRLLRLTL